MVQKTDRPASFPTWGQVRALVFPGDIEIVNVPITGLGQLAWCWVWKCFTDCKVFRCCYVCPQRFSFSTICFNFWKSSNLLSYPLLSVQFSGIKETHIIVQPATPSIHRLFTSKMKLCPNYVLIPHSPSSPPLASTVYPWFLWICHLSGPHMSGILTGFFSFLFSFLWWNIHNRKLTT